jgi:hypothetical protein
VPIYGNVTGNEVELEMSVYPSDRFLHKLLYVPCLVLVNIVTCIPIARQRLGKHIPRKHTRATVGRPFLGNGPVNTPP